MFALACDFLSIPPLYILNYMVSVSNMLLNGFCANTGRPPYRFLHAISIRLQIWRVANETGVKNSPETVEAGSLALHLQAGKRNSPLRTLAKFTNSPIYAEIYKNPKRLDGKGFVPQEALYAIAIAAITIIIVLLVYFKKRKHSWTGKRSAVSSSEIGFYHLYGSG